MEVYLEGDQSIHVRSSADKARRLAKGMLLKAWCAGNMVRGADVPDTAVVAGSAFSNFVCLRVVPEFLINLRLAPRC